jgi:hypothetical protein
MFLYLSGCLIRGSVAGFKFGLSYLNKECLCYGSDDR